MKALILSGGIASRLWPITYTKAKQLLPVVNKPILLYGIESVIKAGINDIGIVVGHTKEEIMKEVGDGSRWGVKITYIYQEQPKGLAHAVKISQPFLQDEPFIMFLGDNIIKDDVRKFMKEYHEKKSNALVVLDKAKDPQKYGIAVLENGDIVELIEKPNRYVSDMVIVGLYIFDKNIFSAVENIQPSRRNELEITDAIQEMIRRGLRVGYGELEHWWKDTGTPQDMLEANQRLLEEIEPCIQGCLDRESMIQGKVTIGKGTQIVNSVLRGPVSIAGGCTIRNAYVGPYTAIDAACEIENAEIEYSIVMDHSAIKDVGKRISSSLVGSNVEIIGRRQVPQTYSFIVADNSKIETV